MTCGVTTLPFCFALPPEADMTPHIPFWQTTGVAEWWLARNHIILAPPSEMMKSARFSWCFHHHPSQLCSIKESLDSEMGNQYSFKKIFFFLWSRMKDWHGMFSITTFQWRKLKWERILSFYKYFMPCLEILGLGSNYDREDILRLYENTHFSVHRPNVITGLNPQANNSIQPLLLSFTDHFSCHAHPDHTFLFPISSLFAWLIFAFPLPEEKYSESGRQPSIFVMKPKEGMSSFYKFNLFCSKTSLIGTNRKRASMVLKVINTTEPGAGYFMNK